jgi:hypothetical protein
MKREPLKLRQARLIEECCIATMSSNILVTDDIDFIRKARAERFNNHLFAHEL